MYAKEWQSLVLAVMRIERSGCEYTSRSDEASGEVADRRPQAGEVSRGHFTLRNP